MPAEPNSEITGFLPDVENSSPFNLYRPT